MRVKGIEAGALLRQRLWSRERGEAFLRLLLDAGSDLTPEFYGRFEPVKTVFDAGDLAGPLSGWGGGFLWRRRRPRISGQYVRGPASAHDAVYLSASAAAASMEKAVSFLVSLQQVFGIDFGYVHVRFSTDANDSAHYARYTMPFSQGLTTHHLREGIPNLPWTVFLGPPYIALFGRACLMTAPCARIVDHGGCVALTLTESISPAEAFAAQLERARGEVKTYLGERAFQSPDAMALTARFELE